MIRRGYSVPPTNPYYGSSDVLWEIWSFGLRNPWRWSFDNPARGGNGRDRHRRRRTESLGGNQLRAVGRRRPQLRLANP